MAAEGRRTPLLAGLACLAGLAGTGALALADPAGQVRDALTLQGFQSLNRPRLTALADRLAHIVDPTPYVVIGAVLVAIALLRRRPRVAAAVVVVMGASVLTSELLKPLLAEQRYYSNGSPFLALGSWPSGHATAAMSVALCAVLVAPRALRPIVAALGTALAVGVSYSVLILSWHFPSDVLGGFFVAAVWICIAVLALREAERRWPARGAGRAIAPLSGMLAPVGLVAAAAGAGLLVILARPELMANLGTGHRSFLAGAFAIAALAWVLATGLAAGLRR
jgi:membrane-associated phospholipid phosphatase